MRYILIDIGSSIDKCDNCRFLKYGRCQLFKDKGYGEDRSYKCSKSDMTDYIKEIIAPLEKSCENEV